MCIFRVSCIMYYYVFLGDHYRVAIERLVGVFIGGVYS